MNLRSAIVLGLLLAVIASQASATGPIIRPADGNSTRNDCVYGNDLYPAIVLMDYFHGNEHLKYHVYPPDYLNCSCDVGFTALNVGMYMEFTDSSYPVDFVAFADVERATWDEVKQCWVPGEIVCESGPWNVQVGLGGGVTVVLPIECPCLPLDAHYFFSFRFASDFAEEDRPNARLDEFPELCTSWQNSGGGWQDFHGDLGWEGNLIITGDVDCCTDPVATKPESWGAIKRLFR